ncbi:response regulator [Zunongwangia endophytica]|uniref:Response regulator transcription factor n=1 Tax=Zunongwangia endophytica TaxID=1808945 RepID=A0ABV8HBP4_9FLAO|nr:response regulator [Zunongwangia endophytica]MDN3593315.1 response regulator [Zunongwangia endophytica]MDN3596935.1 response regulator [Zunongwangia endophytica]MDN3596994.1 response regulator [Zunongwangia endophytica]
MANRLKVLIVDDHPIIIEGYKSTLQSCKHEILVQTANDVDTALLQVRNAEQFFDIIILDIKIPASKDGRIISGEDLGMKFREITPHSKLVVLTMFNEKYRLQNILKSINPEAFMIKSDVGSTELCAAILSINNGIPFYSKTVRELFRSQMTRDITLDENDRKILYYLSKGTKTKNLVDYIPLSLAAIEKRKRNIRKLFEIEELGDKLILDKAEEYGFL